MNSQNKYSKEVLDLLGDPAMRLVWEEEGLLGEFALMVEKELGSRRMTKADLARLISKSPQAVSRALGGSQNLSVRTMLEIALALGRTVKIDLPKLDDLSKVEGPTVMRQTVVKSWRISTETPNPYTGAAFKPQIALNSLPMEAGR